MKSSDIYHTFARHYNLRFVYVFFIFHFGLYWRAVYTTDKICTKNGNSSFFRPKIRSLYTRAVTDQEQVIVALIQYIHGGQIMNYNEIGFSSF